MEHPTDASFALRYLPFVGLGTRAALRLAYSRRCCRFARTLVGAISGYVGGMVHFVLMRNTDAFLAFPVIAGVWLFQVLMQTTNLMLFDYNSLTPIKFLPPSFNSWCCIRA
jgi:ABC-type dipeptide/oligopeptide/nickel transport system permease subunit